MSPLPPLPYEKLLFGVAAGAVVAAGAWVWQEQACVRRVRAEPELPLFGAEDRPAAVPETVSPKHVWPRPSVQPAGDDWLYEVFTPPAFYYDANAQAFVVFSPSDVVENNAPPEFLAVKRAPYRLQLAGYFGEPGDYLVAFVSSEVPQTLLARVGWRSELLGLVFKGFEVRKVAIKSDAAGPAYDIVAEAVLQDEQTGGEVVLDSRGTKFTDAPRAIFRAPDGLGPGLELQEGDAYRNATGSYRIERIRLDPPEVVVVRHLPGQTTPETRVLCQREDVLGDPEPGPIKADWVASVGRGAVAPGH